MSEPRLPTIGEFVRHHGHLVRIATIDPSPPPPPRKEYVFEETEARCELRLRGEVIKELQILNDFYGFETSVKRAIEDMRGYAAERDLGPESELEVVVVKVVTLFWAKPKDSVNFYDKTYRDFERLTHGCWYWLPDPVETVVWSSKTDR